MPSPKEKIARENEARVMAWLLQNDSKLPLSLYRLSKELNFSFGATRGAILRLLKKNPSGIIKVDIFDERSRKPKSLIALRNHPSEIRLKEMVKEKGGNARVHFSLSDKDKDCKDLINDSKGIILSSEIVSTTRNLIKKLLKIDENVLELGQKLPSELLMEFLNADFGLTEKEKESALKVLEVLSSST